MTGVLTRVALVALIAGITRGQPKSTKTDAQIVQEIIKESIASYKGSCPYSKNRAGRTCGRTSAYSKPGGASPICYEKDVTKKMVEDYRKRKEK